MKIHIKRNILLTILFLIAGTGCSKFLDEVSVSNVTADSYYIDQNGFEDLVKSSYTLLRDITQQRDLVFLGTDMFTNLGWNKTSDAGSELNLYDVRMNSEQGSLKPLWDLLYREIERTNTAIERAPGIDMDEALKSVRVGEEKFLRAYCYFMLVQQWGDIPMPLTETKTASKKVVKVAAADVYTQILKDLTDAEAVLPETATDYGRATLGAARFLLARVYLTRGWNFNNSLGGSADDFNKALQYADDIIDAYPLAAKYTDLFPKHSENPLLETFPTQNDQNPEIVFAVQYSDDVLTYSGDPSNPNALPGNNAHSIFGGGVESMPGQLSRTSEYNRQLTDYIVTPAMYRLFDPQMDTRYQLDFVDAIVALHDVNNFKVSATDSIDISKGDTVMSFRPWNDPASLAEKGIDVGGTKHYSVLNTSDFGISDKTPFHDQFQTPLMWKFWQPGIPYDDAMGTLDFVLFRSAEAYLIAAEAIVKGASGAKLGGADVYYNAVLDRALGTNAGSDPQRAADPADVNSLTTASYRATPGNVTIDMILDERARELLGEGMRWYDLKRTGKLIDRTDLMNPWTALKGELDSHHLLRPLPQSELDLSSPTISQNDGY